MATVAELNVAVSADTTGLDSGLAKAQSSFKSFGADLARIGVGMTAAITAPLAFMGKEILRVGTDYEKAMNIFESVTRASADEMARAGRMAQQLGADMKLPATSAGDAAKAMTELAKGGLTAAQAMDAARGTLMLAAAASIGEAEAATIAANALNAFGLAASEASRVSDLLAAAANASSAEITDISLSMQQASAVFASANIPIQDLTAAIGLMANAGIKGSDAGTSLKTMIIALSAPTEKAATEMKRLGINIFDAQGNFIPFRGMIEQVSGALKGMTEQQQAATLKTIFGTDALRAANIVLADGVEKFDKMSDAVNRVGAAEELAGARAKGLSGALDGLTSQFETLGLKIFQSFNTSLEGIVRQLAEFVAFLGTLPAEAMKVGIAIAAVFAAAGPIAIAIGATIALLGGPLTLAIVAITGVVAAMAAAVALNFGRIAQVVSASTTKSRMSLADLALAAGSVLDAFQVFARGAVLVFDIIVTGAVLMAQGVKAAFDGIKGAAKAALALAANDVVGFAAAMGEMATTTFDAATSIRNSLKGLAQRGVGDLKDISNHLQGQFAKSFWLAATQSGKALGEIGSAVTKAGKDIKDAADKGKKGLEQLTDGAKAAAKNMDEATKALLELARAAGATAEFFVNLGIEELKKLFEDLPLPIRKFSDALEIASDGVVRQGKALKDGIGLGRDWLSFINEAKNHQASLARSAEMLGKEYDKLSQQLPHAWNVIIDGFSRGVSATSVKIKTFAGDLINVFDAMPGKWGQSLNKALNEVNRWVSFIDAAIKLVQRMLGDKEPGGLGDVLSKLGGVFKKTTQDIKEATQDIGQGSEDWSERLSAQMSKAATGVESGAGRMVAAFAQIAGAALAFIGAKGQGFVGGAFSGALGGIAAAGGIATALGVALSPLTLGLSAAGGALLGGLIGLFTGKSQAQKDAEKRAAEQAKISMQQTAQTVINAAIQGFDSAIKFFENLEAFTAPRKAKFAEFWKAMTRLMNGFMDLAKTWAGTSLAQAKSLSETIGPIAQAISALPEAFSAISGHFGIAQSSIDRFFDDFSRLMDAFFAKSEIWIDGVSKRAMKVANRLSPVVALISAFGTALSDISDVKEPADEMFAIFDRVIDKIVTHVANLSLKFDKAVLKTMANFAEKAGAALSIWKEAIESIKATVDIQAPSEQSVDNVVAGIELFINKLGGAVERLITTDLARITAFANTIAPIAAAIKAWAETAEVVRGYTAIAAEVWDQIVADFERGLVLLNLLILDAQLYVEKATTFKTLIEQGTSLIDAALRSFGSGISAAASALTGGLPAGGTSMSASAASTLAPMSAASQSASTTVVQPVVHVHVSNMIAHTQVPEFVERAIMDLYRSGRVSGSVFTGLAPAR